MPVSDKKIFINVFTRSNPALADSVCGSLLTPRNRSREDASRQGRDDDLKRLLCLWSKKKYLPTRS